MWKDKGLQLVMLSTENKVNALRGYADRSLLFRYQENYQILESEGDITCYYYLYLLSDEEIKEGDYFLTDDRDRKSDNEGIPIWILHKCHEIRNYWIFPNNNLAIGYNPGWSKKIIASTDPSTNLPSFHSSFLEEYVKRYNSKKSLEVEVSYNVNSKYNDFYNGEQVNQYISTYKVKVDLNNTISILFKEERKYSRGEVEELCRKAARIEYSFESTKEGHEELVNIWIKENLK